MDGAGLSQEEIDALLAGGDFGGLDTTPTLESTPSTQDFDVFMPSGKGAETKQTKTKTKPKKAQPKSIKIMQEAESTGTTTFDILLNVPLNLTVELGRSKMNISEILALGSGSIIELDKLVGEPVNILVNNKFIARGRVICIDESFGVQIVDIIDPYARFEQLNEFLEGIKN